MEIRTDGQIRSEQGTRKLLTPTEFKNTKVGKRVFLLGNGPPLRDWSKEDFASVECDTIGVNRSWMPSRDGRWPGIRGTTYHVFLSGTHAQDLCDGKFTTGVAFCPAGIEWIVREKECGARCKVAIVPVMDSGASPTMFTFDLERGIMTKFAGYFALQVAAFMGYSEIFLVGYSANDYEGHSYEDPASDGRRITRGGQVRWYQGAKAWADTTRRRIVNCDPNSAIDYFPKMPREEVLAELAQIDEERFVL